MLPSELDSQRFEILQMFNQIQPVISFCWSSLGAIVRWFLFQSKFQPQKEPEIQISQNQWIKKEKWEWRTVM